MAIDTSEELSWFGNDRSNDDDDDDDRDVV